VWRYGGGWGCGGRKGKKRGEKVCIRGIWGVGGKGVMMMRRRKEEGRLSDDGCPSILNGPQKLKVIKITYLVDKTWEKFCKWNTGHCYLCWCV